MIQHRDSARLNHVDFRLVSESRQKAFAIFPSEAEFANISESKATRDVADRVVGKTRKRPDLQCCDDVITRSTIPSETLLLAAIMGLAGLVYVNALQNPFVTTTTGRLWTTARSPI